ncbi:MULTISPECIES: LacI family DNA-binding transcriptional regulator [unclassified Tolypothrix]|uniref:LacI family DNA-binding transcriptional regulator n=1 Tax=unclassified Tolypothrix TaxID=2649714 RepID=UPI0005EAA4C6|nr:MULTISPECIES: LacI family DNA-binding transcriptional regulator [unclassified Tolypothrix]BAY88330.1 transcriptional regulator HrmR [Microchaete diplosiphon NIES-3275]EKF02311.1 transcriptional regulator PurR [Tolypothrix sp. PCC 7601]MBE9083655.1 LacI family DNA-binding transcriptional regulator [Tolypothrix sp. LEGE 11397]UYD29018.1 LacI family DNA-binding transcriptional regulator [Tolypothrix sp. PCC 7712]UYD35068.1 LacI family DNA-binding transcriptional regulator [Tolypothrix sp. PCC 
MSKRKISIEDIARKAGVSHTTVSRALRDSSLISAKVREEIKQLAREMGYVPNGIAQSLQTQRTNTIGVVVTSIADPFFAEVIEGIEQIAKSSGLSVLLSTSHRNVEQEIAAIDNFYRRRVDGILVADSRITTNHSQQIGTIAAPTVFINSQTANQPQSFHSVRIDDYLGARLAVQHLVSLGHTSIGYLGVGDRSLSNQLRQEGYQTVLSEANLPQIDDWIAIREEDHTRTSDVVTGQQMLPQLVKAGVTSIFCYNDMVAVGALLACKKLGISVPLDLSLVGFDGIALGGYITPPLTTIRQPMLEIGRVAMQMLLDLLQDKTVENRILSPYLIERGSTARRG